MCTADRTRRNSADADMGWMMGPGNFGTLRWARHDAYYARLISRQGRVWSSFDRKSAALGLADVDSRMAKHATKWRSNIFLRSENLRPGNRGTHSVECCSKMSGAETPI